MQTLDDIILGKLLIIFPLYIDIIQDIHIIATPAAAITNLCFTGTLYTRVYNNIIWIN